MSISTVRPYDLRNATLAETAEALKDQRAHSVDFVLPANRLSFLADGTVAYDYTLDTPVITEDGVTTADVFHADLSDGAIGDLAARYEIPVGYARRIYSDGSHLPLGATTFGHFAALDQRNVLVRALTDGDRQVGYIRAIKSDRFAVGLDDYDAMIALLGGIRDAGINPTDITAHGDVTPNRLAIRVNCPTICVDASDIVDTPQIKL